MFALLRHTTYPVAAPSLATAATGLADIPYVGIVHTNITLRPHKYIQAIFFTLILSSPSL